ncbi:SDR family NAD(P)-dependent oxidoreductase [Pseudoalteromonas luteoviolacea]|uniref:type I polyketide synthase n=1 Tax=Pseudoalteromonas luteoviolacea TaxID=43657 RepID=UPI001F43DE27|nr:type I polyketide synthase [Pseudoalteromonas luteoviolacea]MCF6437894.1 SDR family NAD(P)-dependent oxidoreductase [Pseudoalteromonas luteoviolacea]
MSNMHSINGSEIAIIGMSCRFPDAQNINQYWQNLLAARESIRHFSEQELVDAGVSESLINNPDYVRAKGIIDDATSFDAAFFGYSEREAILMDPQLRIYHECAWHALEDAGYADSVKGSLTGIYGGASLNTLWASQFKDHATQGGVAAYETINLINRDFFNSRLAYLLGLKGPAVTLQTACSTGLVSVHHAIQGLLSGDCDMALAGSVSMSTNPEQSEPDKQGYVYQEGMILSPDGHCRPFDDKAKGTVLSDGAGFVVLKRLEDAVRDGDRVYCVIKGSAINNDGDDKVGYTAPSVQGQQEVIEAALSIADIDPAHVSYIEAHGTGTNLGDPIEITALEQSYSPSQKQPLLVGSVKSNLGHLDTAAGMAGLLKVALSIFHKTLPPTLHFTTPNSKCAALGDTIKPITEVMSWHHDHGLNAAVSSFGIGGTNAHLILNQMHMDDMDEACNGEQVLNKAHPIVIPVSARDAGAVSRKLEELSEYLMQSDATIADAYYTLLRKRAQYEVRGALVLNEDKQELVSVSPLNTQTSSVHFMFTGQGSQHVGMAQNLYQQYPYFRGIIDKCVVIAAQFSDAPIKDLLIAPDKVQNADIDRTDVAQLCLFIYEYAAARLLMHTGVTPSSMIGHSLGEYVAACLADVFTVEQGIRLIAERGRLMQATEKGCMIAVMLEEAALKSRLPEGAAIAAHNGNDNYVISGSETQISLLCQRLENDDIGFFPITTSGAFHSSLMDPILAQFKAVLADFDLQPNRIPIVSNLTGDWIRPEQVVDPEYWVSHLRNTVNFHKGINCILAEGPATLLEIGPQSVLQKLVERNVNGSNSTVLSIANSEKRPKVSHGFAVAIANLFVSGVDIQWHMLQPVTGKAIWIPPHPFERNLLPSPSLQGATSNDSDQMYFTEAWTRKDKRELRTSLDRDSKPNMLLIASRAQDMSPFIDLFSELTGQCVCAELGETYQQDSSEHFVLGKDIASDFNDMLGALSKVKQLPDVILYIPEYFGASNAYKDHLNLVSFGQAISEFEFDKTLSLICLTQGLAQANGTEVLDANSGLLFGPLRVLQQEVERVKCHLIDIDSKELTAQVNTIVEACLNPTLPFVTALRGRYIWEQDYQEERISEFAPPMRQIKQNGVYIITGGFGGVGAHLATFLAEHFSAKLVLCSRWNRSRDPLVDKIRDKGGEVLTVEADFTISTSFDQVYLKATERFGHVDGVLHTAGLPGETLIHRMPSNELSDVVKVKIATAQKMVSYAQQQQLDFVIFFSSVTGVLGGPGQCEYTSANAYLSLLAKEAESRGIANVFAIDWDAWKSSGMAYNAHNGGQKLIQHDVHPLLGDQVIDQPQIKCFKKCFAAESLWVLHEHEVIEQPTVPGTSYLDMARAGYEILSGKQQATIQNVYFLMPLALNAGEQADVYTVFKPGDNGAYTFEVGSYHLQEQVWRVHAQGQIGRQEKAQRTQVSPEPTAYLRHLTDIQGASHLGELAMADALEQSERERLMKYGQRWDLFNDVWLNENRAVAKLTLADKFIDDLARFKLHPSMLDCALSFFRPFVESGLFIPVSVGELDVYDALPNVLYSHAELIPMTGQQSDVISFNIGLYDDSGKLLAYVKNFVMQRIHSLADKHSEHQSKQAPSYVSKYEEIAHGLEPEAAIEAVKEVLAAGTQHVIVALPSFSERFVKNDYADWMDQSQLSVNTGKLQPRPNIATEFMPAITETQKQISEIWAQMLGLESVGVNDDFFELGGNSLVLMQIHKHVQANYSKEISVVELYDYPTIALLADRIDQNHTDVASELLNDVEERSTKQKEVQRRRRTKRSAALRLLEEESHGK